MSLAVSKKESLELQICKIRHTIYGLSACDTCPIFCSMASEQSNIELVAYLELEKLEEEYSEVE